MKVFRDSGKYREYDITVTTFIKSFNRRTIQGSARRPLSFDKLTEQLAHELSMKKIDVVRAISVLLRKSKKFRTWTWFYCSYSGKGSIRMEKVTGWCPLEPFDHVASRIIFNDELISEMVKEATSPIRKRDCGTEDCTLREGKECYWWDWEAEACQHPDLLKSIQEVS